MILKQKFKKKLILLTFLKSNISKNTTKMFNKLNFIQIHRITSELNFIKNFNYKVLKN